MTKRVTNNYRPNVAEVLRMFIQDGIAWLLLRDEKTGEVYLFPAKECFVYHAQQTFNIVAAYRQAQTNTLEDARTALARERRNKGDGC